MASKEREKTFHSDQKEGIVTEITDTLPTIIPWKIVFLKGIIYGFVILLFTLGVSLLLNLINYGGFIQNYSFLLILEAGIFWIFSGLKIWFGPSPSYASIKSKILNQTVKPISTSDALREGMIPLIIGIILVLFV